MPLHPPPEPWRRDWGGMVIGALAIVFASAAFGLIANHLSPHGIPVVQRVEAGRVPLPPGMREIGLEDTKAAVDGKSAVVIDARAPEEYAAGHLPGAFNVPPDQIGDALPRIEERVTKAPRVIIYCQTEDCGDAISVAEYVTQIAPDKVFIFVGGWRAWSAAGYPSTKGDQP